MICSACNDTALESLCSLGSIPLCDDFRGSPTEAMAVPMYKLSPLICPRCRHIELQEKPDCSSVYKNYIYRSRHSIDLKAHFDSYVDAAITLFDDLAGHPPKTVLDVGCNDGLLLERFGNKLRDAVLHGIDPSPAIFDVPENVTAHHTLFTGGYIDEAKLSSQFDIVCCNNTLANISNVQEFLERLGSCLANTGLLIIETGYGPATLLNSVWDMVNHEHFHYFSLDSMLALGRRCGLKLIRTEIQKTKGGSVRAFFVKNQSRVRSSAGNIDSLLAFESALFVNRDSFVESVRLRLEGARENCKAVKSSSSRIVHFGASAGSTILVHALGYSDIAGCIVDDNRDRHGLYLPGSCARVVGIDEVDIDHEVTVVVWSWRFVQEIMERHPSLGRSREVIYGNTFRPVSR